MEEFDYLDASDIENAFEPIDSDDDFPHDDDSDDEQALTSAGFGTDEDYGPLCDPEWECRHEE